MLLAGGVGNRHFVLRQIFTSGSYYYGQIRSNQNVGSESENSNIYSARHWAQEGAGHKNISNKTTM